MLLRPTSRRWHLPMSLLLLPLMLLRLMLPRPTSLPRTSPPSSLRRVSKPSSASAAEAGKGTGSAVAAGWHGRPARADRGRLLLLAPIPACVLDQRQLGDGTFSRRIPLNQNTLTLPPP